MSYLLAKKPRLLSSCFLHPDQHYAQHFRGTRTSRLLNLCFTDRLAYRQNSAESGSYLRTRPGYSSMTTSDEQRRPSSDVLSNSTRYRYVSNEAEELNQRHVKFNVEELSKEAARAAGSKNCVSITKGDDGSFNRVLLLEMDDGKQVFAKIPTPNAGPANEIIASEVATMEFVRCKLGIPVPRVLSWHSKASQNPIGPPYIIMEKVEGVPLSEVWESMSIRQRSGLTQNFADMQRAWISASFNSYGSLYFARDLKAGPSTKFLYVNADGNEVIDEQFVVGPTVGRGWLEEGRAKIQFDRGPWRSVEDYKRAIGKREITCIESIPKLPRSWMFLYGPETYIRRRKTKIEAVRCYLELIPYLLPLDQRLNAAILWHADTHAENIFVDPKNPEKIVGIIDWQSIEIAPLFEYAPQPGFLDHSGPSVEGFERPKMPSSLDSLNQEDKNRAREIWVNQTLEVYYRTLIRKQIPLLDKVRQFCETDAENLLLLAQQLLVDGEAHYLHAVTKLQSEWTQLPAVKAMSRVPDFPISFSESDTRNIEHDAIQSLKAMDAMNDLKVVLGIDLPDRGAVLPEDYDRIKSRLKDIKRQFEQKYAPNGGLEWPYDD